MRAASPARSLPPAWCARSMPCGATSAADLKFLHRLRQTHFRNFKSKSGTRIINLLVPLLLPKFVSEGAAMYHELRKRGTSAVADFDVLIAGAGPAGCAGAISLADFAPGLSVCLVDAPQGFRIGETVPPQIRPVLEHLGVWRSF